MTGGRKMKNKIGCGGASMVLLLIGLVVISLVAAISHTPSARAETPEQDDVGAVQRAATPMTHKLSPGSLVAQPTGVRMTIDWSRTQGGGPMPNDAPFGPNVRVWDDPAEQSRPSLAIQPTTGYYYLVFQHFNGADWDIYLTISQDDGGTWIGPIAFANSDSNEKNPSIAATSQGAVIVAWQDAAQPTLFMFAHSPDGVSFLGYYLDIGGLWSGSMTDLQYPTVVTQRNPGSYADGLMFQGQVFCDDATNCGGGAHTAFWLGEPNAGNDPASWSFTLGGYYWLVDPAPGGTHLADPIHPSAFWSSDNYVMVMDEEATDNTEWKMRLITMSEDGSSPDRSWVSVIKSDDGIFSAGAADGGTSVVAGTYRQASDPTRHQIYYYSTTDGWNNLDIGALDAAITDQRAVSVAGTGTEFHVTYYSGSVMTDALVDTGGGVNIIKVSDNSGTAVNDEKATSVYLNAFGTPVIAWQDNRDGNVNIYATGYLTFPVYINATCGGVPYQAGILIDTADYVSTPYVHRWPADSVHEVRILPLTQQAGFCKRCSFAKWDDGMTNPVRAFTLTSLLKLTAIFDDKFRVQLDSSPVPLNLTWSMTTQLAPFIAYVSPGTYAAEAPSPQYDVGTGKTYVFEDWSDGLTDNPRTVVVGTGCANLTANFGTMFLITIKTNPPGLLVSYDAGPFQESPVQFLAGWGSIHSVVTIGTQYDPVNPDSVRYRFMQWDSGATSHGLNFTVTGPLTVTASFTTQYKLDLPSPDMGDVRCVFRPDCWYDSGELATVEVTTPWPPSAVYIRYIFDGWSGDATGMSNPIILTMDGPKTVYADWATQYKVTVSTAQSTVTCSPSTDCWFGAGTDAFLTLSETIVPGGAGIRYVFLSWSGDASGDDNPVTVMMDTPKNVTTTWKTQYKVTKNTPYSTLACSPNADCWFDDGSTATVTLADLTVPGGPGTRYNFKEWTGDASGNSNPITLTMDGAKTVTATWTTQHKLTVNTAHSTCSCLPNSDCWFNEDTSGTVTLADAVVPGGPGERFVFKEWTGDETGSSLTLTVLMDGPKSVMAVWDTQYKITVTTDYSTVTCSPRSDCWFIEGSTATITLAERVVAGDIGTRYAFENWAGDLSGDDSQVNITVDGPKDITAVWSTQYLLVITSNCGAYSNCGYPNGSGWYDADTGAVAQVTTPCTDPSGDIWDFSNWTGDGSGTSPMLPLTMDGPKSVNANWILNEGSGEQPPNQQSPMDIAIWALAAAVVAAIAASLITYLVVRRKGPSEDESPPEESETDETIPEEETR
jgi:uncharacterized repeat protein (TIGR02543 family)